MKFPKSRKIPFGGTAETVLTSFVLAIMFSSGPIILSIRSHAMVGRSSHLYALRIIGSLKIGL